MAAYQGQFAWNPALTYEGFYDGFALRCYGQPWASRMSEIHRELELLGPRWTGATAETDIRIATWLAKEHAGKKENRQKLARIRAELEAVHKEMIAQSRLEGIERIEWLLTTIDWLTRYDDACLKLSLDGPVGTLLKEAEAAKTKGDVAAAQKKAAERPRHHDEEWLPRSHSNVPTKDELHERVRRIRIHPNQGLCILPFLVGKSERHTWQCRRQPWRPHSAGRLTAADSWKTSRERDRAVARPCRQRRRDERKPHRVLHAELPHGR